MSYPKPLSEKSLRRLYENANLTDAQIGFTRDFLTACANLNGVLMADDAWDIYRELSTKTETVRLHRRDMYAAIGILRREELSFFVFEADEVFDDEPRSDKYRVIALRNIVGEGYGKFTDLYRLLDASQGRAFYVPANLLAYSAMPENPYENALVEMLGDLKSTLEEYEDDWGHKHPCKFTGRRLREFSYISSSDEFELQRLRGEIEGFKGNAKKAAELEEELNRVTAAQYLVDGLKWRSNLGMASSKSIKYFFDTLNRMGVSFSEDKQVNRILGAVNALHNNQHLWCNRGWSPDELSARMPASGITSLSFGPNIQQAFAEGTMDRDELVRELSRMGIEVLE